MAEFSRLVVTDKGSGLIMKTINGSDRIRFTRISTSARKYLEEELKGLMLLEDTRQRGDISEISMESSSTIQIRSVISNADLAEGYYIKAVGLYAEDPDDGEILYGVSVEQSDNGCYVPPYNHQTVSSLYFNLSVAVGNSDNVLLEIDPGAVVTIKQLSAVQEKIVDIVYQQATGYTDEKIAALINGAPTTLDTLGEIAQAMQDNEGVVDALDEAIGSKASAAEFDSYKKATDAVLGNADISGIGDGSLTGAVKELNTGIHGIVGLHGTFMQPALGIDDCNDLPIGYCGYTYVITKNAPDAYMLVQCLGVSNSFKFQIGIDDKRFMFRYCYEQEWSAWVRLQQHQYS